MKYPNKPNGVSKKRLHMADKRRMRHSKRRTAKLSVRHRQKPLTIIQKIKRQLRRMMRQEKKAKQSASWVSKEKRLTYRRQKVG